jgi:predicted nucleic acid-binding protein
MFLLDTNVISEMRKIQSGRADLRLSRWIQSVRSDDFYLSAITIFEMEVGVQLMMRKDPAQGRFLWDWLHAYVLPSFATRILVIDAEVSLRCAALHVPVTAPYHDSLIGATALVHGMTVVTRNVKDFVPMGVKVLNP